MPKSNQNTKALFLNAVAVQYVQIHYEAIARYQDKVIPSNVEFGFRFTTILNKIS